jgi:hypothetical protein
MPITSAVISLAAVWEKGGGGGEGRGALDATDAGLALRCPIHLQIPPYTHPPGGILQNLSTRVKKSQLARELHLVQTSKPARAFSPSMRCGLVVLLCSLGAAMGAMTAAQRPAGQPHPAVAAAAWRNHKKEEPAPRKVKHASIIA